MSAEIERPTQHRRLVTTSCALTCDFKPKSGARQATPSHRMDFTMPQRMETDLIGRTDADRLVHQLDEVFRLYLEGTAGGRKFAFRRSFDARETSNFSGRLRAVEVWKTPELSHRNLLLLFRATTTILPRRLSRRGSNKPWRIVRSPLGRSAKESGRMERERGADAPIEQSTAGGFGSVATSVAKKPILQPADSDDEYPHSMPVDGSVPSSAKESGRMERERGADAPIEQSTAGGSGLAATSVAKQPILQPADSDDEYPHSMPGDGSVPSDLDPEEVTRYVLEELLPMGTPHEYQVEAISSIVFDRQNLVLIRRTGEGKSVVPLAVTAMRRKVTIVLVSLIGLGSDQATKNFLEGERVEAIHLDENKSQLDFDRVNKRIDKMIQDKNNGIMKEGIIMYVSPMKLESNAQWQQMFVKLAQNDLIIFVLHRRGTMPL
ncbi:hypothetical protein THAOC_23821 [Thalassiosira oceanica]|uniref:DEAD/DEAH box helicase domain-containing protein n=1 Tax=Thalassiosira oceanica TaxID=159749 RepID=K0RRB7_THAOC|nr:hypothetical protein THAOC_23821 [Thalassiosira oceanica]|eukprot:EJK56323.1 hypothetical protein THAOC_23821 [Thalassiosira oceanica]